MFAGTNKVKDRWPAYSSPKKASKKTNQVGDSFAEAEDLEVSVPNWLQVKEAADTGSEDESSSSDSATESSKKRMGDLQLPQQGRRTTGGAGRRTGTVEWSLLWHR